MVNLPSLISFTYLATVGLAPHSTSRLFGKLDARRHLIAPCAIAGEATAAAPPVAAIRVKFRREIVMQSSLMLPNGFEARFLLFLIGRQPVRRASIAEPERLSSGISDPASVNRVAPLRELVGAVRDEGELASSKQKPRHRCRGFAFAGSCEARGSEVHAAHAAARRHCGAGCGLLRQFGDHGFRGDQEASD